MLLAWWLEREVVVVDSQEQLLDLPRSNKEDLAHSRANQNTKSNKEKKKNPPLTPPSDRSQVSKLEKKEWRRAPLNIYNILYCRKVANSK